MNSLLAQDRKGLYDHYDTSICYYVKVPSKIITNKAIIVCPGGGYTYVSILHEGIEAAKYLSELGFDLYVLHYRISNAEKKFYYPSQLEDVHALYSMIQFSYEKIGIIGFSAGGHLAGMFLTQKNVQLDFGILIYPVISSDSSIWHRGSFKSLLGDNYKTLTTEDFSVDKRIHVNTPPLFFLHAKDDMVVPYQNSVRAYEASKLFKDKSELHLFDKGGHGFGMREIKFEIQVWKELLKNWLKQF